MPLLLLLPLLFFNWQPIEEDVADNAQAYLIAAGADWVKVETTNRGRDILITGIPPNDVAIEFAREKSIFSYGVNRVDVSLDIKPILTPPVAVVLNTIITGTEVALSGTLADQDSIDAIVAEIGSVFSVANVSIQLKIGLNTSALPNLEGFFANLSGKSFCLETLTASLRGNQLSLKGTVNSDESNSILVSQMIDQLGLKVSTSLTIATASNKLKFCQERVNEQLSITKIGFASGGKTISKESFALLENIKSIASNCVDSSFDVSGYTDSTSNLGFNMKLSKRRAQAVVDHLVGLSLNAAKLTAIGYGPNKPVADNSTPEGRAQNRRIEFTLKN
ncbi:MAG: OOP family OmpA-OmpF porin [Arenicella sp.]